MSICFRASASLLRGSGCIATLRKALWIERRIPASWPRFCTFQTWRCVDAICCPKGCASCEDARGRIPAGMPPEVAGSAHRLSSAGGMTWRPGGERQLAPYNTQYERLALHLSQAGVTAEPNLWDKPVTLAREHGRATPDSGTDIPGGTALPKARDPVQLLPPDRLVPFMVPFQGGRGPMCGGAASSNVTRCAPTGRPPVLVAALGVMWRISWCPALVIGGADDRTA